MLITRKSFMTGEIHTRDIPVEKHELFHWNIPQRSVEMVKHECYNGKRVCIQDAFPNLNPSEREFLMTGITDEEWDTLSDD